MDKSFAVTPPKVLLSQAPTMGLRTPSAKFQVPVKNANMVASTPGGVIFAKRAIVGKINMAIMRQPNTTSVKTMNIKSLTPIRWFHRMANAK